MWNRWSQDFCCSHFGFWMGIILQPLWKISEGNILKEILGPSYINHFALVYCSRVRLTNIIGMHFSTDCQIIRWHLQFENKNNICMAKKSGQWNVHGIWVGPRSKVYLASNKSWKINNLPFNILKLVHTQEWKLQFKVILIIWNTYGVSGKIVLNIYRAIHVFFYLWKNLIFQAFK